MANSSDLIIQLFPDNSVGDDAGKHNFNALSLESKVCNLSGEFFGPDNIFIDTFSNFLSGAFQLETYAKILNLGKNYSVSERLNRMFTTVSLLSSYWEAYEFGTIFPVNISTAFHPTIRQNEEDLFFQTDSLIAYTLNTDLDTILAGLKKYLEEYHPIENYGLNTRINVSVPFYSRLYDPASPEKASIVSLSNEFSHYKRNLTAHVTRKGTNFVSSKIFKFIRGATDWNLINVICPMATTIDNTALSARQIVELTIDTNVANYDISLAAKLSPNYEPGKSEIVLTIQPGVKVYSTTPSSPALILGNLEDNDTIVLFNYGLILGAGGQGGRGGDGELVSDTTKPTEGGHGGVALAVFATNTIIENQGAIYGGGGGGAGGLGGIAGSGSAGGGGGGGAGYNPGESGYRGTTQRLVNRFVIVQDGQPGNNVKGGTGGPGLIGSDSLPAEDLRKIEGKRGGDVGQPGESAFELNKDGDLVEVAAGGLAGAYILGETNVIWTVKGDVKGRSL